MSLRGSGEILTPSPFHDQDKIQTPPYPRWTNDQRFPIQGHNSQHIWSKHRTFSERTKMAELSAYRDQHFKVLFVSPSTLSLSSDLFHLVWGSNFVLLWFRVRVMSSKAYWKQARRCTLEIYHFTQPKNKYMNCFLELETWKGSLWVWTRSRRLLVDFASLSILLRLNNDVFICLTVRYIHCICYLRMF